MNPAEELRAAAKVLRETASNATPGPWTRYGDKPYEVYREPSADHDGEYVTHGSGREDDAEWIALASPALAEPLAAWLETCANDFADARHYIDEPNSCEHALAVARAINGSTS